MSSPAETVRVKDVDGKLRDPYSREDSRSSGPGVTVTLMASSATPPTVKAIWWATAEVSSSNVTP